MLHLPAEQAAQAALAAVHFAAVLFAAAREPWRRSGTRNFTSIGSSGVNPVRLKRRLIPVRLESRAS